MGSRSTAIILMLALLIIGGSYWAYHRSFDISETASPASKSQVVEVQLPVGNESFPVPSPRVEVEARTSVGLAPNPKAAFEGRPSAAIRPTDPIAEFRLVNGVAVAFGDIALGKPDEPVKGGKGFARLPNLQLWLKSEIPYQIHPDLPEPERVEKALTYLRERTPVNFVPYRGEPDAIVFEPATQDCISPLGKVGGLQPIWLAPGCGSQQVLHEILHALGFIHEQMRIDRDRFIEILWNQIDPQYQWNFAMVPESYMDPLRGFKFDFHSVMLYRPDSFALKKGLPTMRPLGADMIDPVREGLSEGDIQRLNRMFRGYE